MRVVSLFLIIVIGFTLRVGADTIIGRQLFVDDYIIAQSSFLKKHHHPIYSELNPILQAEHPWEFSAKNEPYAAPFSGGIWYDENLQRFRMWYSAGGNCKDGLITCYAESLDGKEWKKPVLDVVPGTNIVDTLEHDCVSVLYDRFETDPAKRYKMFAVIFNSPTSVRLVLKYSSDGIHWGDIQASSGEIHDRTGVYYDPFQQKYVLSLKTINGKYRRARNYIAGEDPELIVSLTHRTFDHGTDKFIRFWFNADDDDPRHELFPELRPQIYNHEAMPYESMLLGFFTVWQGPENKECRQLGIQKKNEVLIGWSRDGLTWNREDKIPFHPVGEKGAWHEGNIQSTAGVPLIVGDSLYFYMSGRYNNPAWRSNFSTGLATLRRDGFVSLHADGKESSMTTKPILLDRTYLFVNADLQSDLTIEIIKDDKVIIKKRVRKFNSTKEECLNLMDFKNETVQIRFSFRKGDMYAFWLADAPTGESCGYTAGGGPGLSSSGMDIKK